MPGSSDRAARLDALVADVDRWVKARTVLINRIIESQKKIVKARGTPSQNASDAATSVVVTALKEFTG